MRSASAGRSTPSARSRSRSWIGVPSRYSSTSRCGRTQLGVGARDAHVGIAREVLARCARARRSSRAKSSSRAMFRATSSTSGRSCEAREEPRSATAAPRRTLPRSIANDARSLGVLDLQRDVACRRAASRGGPARARPRRARPARRARTPRRRDGRARAPGSARAPRTGAASRGRGSGRARARTPAGTRRRARRRPDTASRRARRAPRPGARSRARCARARAPSRQGRTVPVRASRHSSQR